MVVASEPAPVAGFSLGNLMYIELKSDDQTQIERMLANLIAQESRVQISLGKEGYLFTLAASTGEEEPQPTSS